jgi:hypothetical protein
VRDIQFAPAPWSIEPYVDAIDILDANGVPVAHVADRRIDAIGSPPENARLLVAAPDLLAALKRLVICVGGKYGQFAADAEAAYIAIAKAEGRKAP